MKMLKANQVLNGRSDELLKGESSWWANENELVLPKLVWGRGYGAFSVSHSHIDKVCKYIANQEEHHRKKTFQEEVKALVKPMGYGGLMMRKGSDHFCFHFRWNR